MEQPNTSSERMLNNVLEDKKDIIELGKKKYAVGWLKKGTIRRISDTILSNKNEDELSAKCASLILLNGFWKIKLFHWVYWRYLWKKYPDEQLMKVIVIAKKKVESQQQTYLANTIFLIGMKDTIMTMTKAEAERTLQELKQEQASH